MANIFIIDNYVQLTSSVMIKNGHPVFPEMCEPFRHPEWWQGGILGTLWTAISEFQQQKKIHALHLLSSLLT
jgi:hypothetical protein